MNIFILMLTIVPIVGSLKYIALPFDNSSSPVRPVHRKSNVSISCELDDPTVNVSLLLKIGKSYDRVGDYVGERLEKTGQKFILRNVRLNDHGVYVCETINQDGSPLRLTKGLLFIVEAACLEQPIIKQGDMKIFEKGDTFSITCTAPGQPNGAPRKSLFWTRKNNESLAVNEKVESSITESDDVINGIFHDVETLTVTNASSIDAGVYVCYRKLAKCPGHTRRETFIRMKYRKPFPPRITNPISSEFFPAFTSNFTLNCTVTSSPLSTITWKNDGAIFRTCAKQNSCLLSWQQNLSGNYTCEAVNSEGEDSMNVKIIFAVKPQIDSVLTSSDEKLLTCETSSGYPKPRVYWEKEVKCLAEDKCDQKWKNVSIYASINSYDTLTGVKSIINFGETEEYGKFRCVALNVAGESIAELYLAKEGESKKTLLIAIFCAIIFMLIAILVSCFCYREHVMKKKFAPLMTPDPKFRLDPNRSLFEQSIELPYPPEWEFPKERLRFINSLGSGAFGQVWLAAAKGIYALSPRENDSMAVRRRASLRFHKQIPHKLLRCFLDDDRLDEDAFVAVKTLKASPSDVEYKDLASEIKVLIHIGSHENIVNLLGACTRGGNLCAIIEYCPYGNLVNFLRPRRDVYSCNWLKQCDNYNDDFCYLDVAYMALQIANGMQFLSERKLVHRDLAARNILVGNNYVMKIADFGLSRNIEYKDYYFKESSGMLPVKWMAPESIFNKIYTIKSDVWSFGILLWEICTMGGSPYPGISMEVLLDKLQQGYRMSQPLTCPEELYQLMLLCWRECPGERPWFNEIVNYLNEIITNKIHISDNLAAFERLQSTSSESEYLVPKSPVKKKGSLDTLLGLKSLSTHGAVNRKKSCDLLHFPPTCEKSENNNEMKAISEQRYVPLQGSRANVLDEQIVSLEEDGNAAYEKG